MFLGNWRRTEKETKYKESKLSIYTPHIEEELSFICLTYCTPEEQDGQIADAKVDEAAMAVCHKRTKICSHNTLPPRSICLVKILHQQTSSSEAMYGRSNFFMYLISSIKL